MGKVPKNKVGPEKNFKPKRDNFFQKKKVPLKNPNNKLAVQRKENLKSTFKNFKQSKGAVVEIKTGSQKKLYKPKKNDGYDKPFFVTRDQNETKNLKKRNDKDIVDFGVKKVTLNKNKYESTVSPSTSGKFSVTKNEDEAQGPSTQNDRNPSKKPFDKKKWRMQKYSKKYKLEQWEDKRKQTVLRGYYNQIKDDKKFDVQKIYEQDQSDDENSENETKHNLNESISRLNEVNQDAVDGSSGSNVNQNSAKQHNLGSRKNKAFQKAREEFQRIKKEKELAKEERQKAAAERKEALKEYKQKKVEKVKRLNKRTRKGQPIMRDRMEMLFEQVQKSVGLK